MRIEVFKLHRDTILGVVPTELGALIVIDAACFLKFRVLELLKVRQILE